MGGYLDIHYKGFPAKILYASGVDIFYGTVFTFNDIIAFQAGNPQDAENAMKEAVDQYLAHIAKLSRVAAA